MSDDRPDGPRLGLCPEPAGEVRPSLDEFVAEVHAFLGRSTKHRVGGRSEVRTGSDLVPVFAHDSADDGALTTAAARRWARRRFDAGFAWVDGPPAYGGRDLPASYADTYRDLESGYDLPSVASLMVGFNIAVPTLLAHARPELRRRYVPAILSGEILVCQLFSEPEAGSDLAGLRTKAVFEDGAWSVTGQKVWTSEAQHADVGLLLARTSPDKPKHKGITLFLSDVTDPAVTIRPLRQMTGDFHFNEVFIDGLRIDDRLRIGELDAGWGAALTVLGAERRAVGARDDSPESALLDRVTALASAVASPRLARDPLLRDQVARAYASVRVLETTNGLLAARTGGRASPELSASKLLKNRALAAIVSAAEDVLGEDLTTDTGGWGTYAWSRALLAVSGQRIAGGTDEIQRNIIAERVLGLPREPQ